MEGEPPARTQADRVFAPDSTMWEVSRELVILLGGPSAAILQIAHPHVAEGVARFSGFRKNALTRLIRTLEAVYGISFGTREYAEEIREKIRRLHAPVHGHVEIAGHREAYSAFDPDAQKWVLATLTHTAIGMFEEFVRPLTEQEKTGYVRDMSIWGSFFGLRPERNPDNWPDFLVYWNRQLDDPRMGAHPEARDFARAIVYPRPAPLGLLAAPMAFVTRTWLPEPIRSRLGLHPRRGDPLAWAVFREALRRLIPTLPDAARFAPLYLEAREASGQELSASSLSDLERHRKENWRSCL